MLHPGDTVLMPTSLPGVKPHLWVIATEPQPGSFLCVIVNVTTLRSSSDQTLILRKGEHPFLRRDSAMSYKDAQIVDARRVEAQIQVGKAQQHPRCTASLLSEIQAGLLASPFTPNKVRAFCK